MVRAMTLRIGSYTAVDRPDGGHRASRSTVWRGEDEAGSPVCLLLVPVADAGGVARAVAAAGAVSHRHLLPVIDVVTDAERVAVVAGWPRGGRLLELVRRRGPLPAEVTLTVLLPLASALAAIHRCGMRHGGVGAGSVFFDDGGRPLLGALATSTVISDGNGGLPTESWDVAPELVRGERLARAPMTPAADIFSLGSVALYCLTGAPAWPAYDPADVLIQSAAGVWPEPPRDARSPALTDVIDRMLQDDPAARPTAEELVGLLAAIGPPAPVPLATGRGPAPAAGARWTGRSAEPVSARDAVPVVASEGAPGAEATVPDGDARDAVPGAAAARMPAADAGAVASDSGAPAAGPAGSVRERFQRRVPTGRRAVAADSAPPSGHRVVRGREALRQGADPQGRRGRRPPSAEAPRAGSPTAQPFAASPRPADRRAGDVPRGRTPLTRMGIAVLSVVLTVVVALQVWVWSTGAEESAAARIGNATTADPSGSAAPSGSVPVADEDWLTVVRALDAARSSAVAAADPGLLARVYVAGSVAAEADTATIRSLVERRWRVSGGLHVIDEVTVIGSAAPSQQTGAAPNGSAASPSAAPSTQPATGASATGSTRWTGTAAAAAAATGTTGTAAAATGTAATGTTATGTAAAGTAAAGTATATVAPPTATAGSPAVRVAVRGSLPAYPVLDAEGRHVADTAARPRAEWILTIAATEVGYRISAVEQG